MIQVGTPAATASAQIGESAVPVAVVEQDGSGRLDVELDQGLGLGLHVARATRPGWPAVSRAIASAMLAVRLLGRIAGHRRDALVRDRRRVEEDERGRSDAGARQRRRGHRAPAVTDDLEIRAGQAGRADPGGDDPRRCRGIDGGPRQWPVRPWPGRSTATTRRPVAASAGPTRHQIRPRRSRRGSAASGRAVRLAPGDRRERDAGRLDRQHASAGRDGLRPRACGDRRRQVAAHRAGSHA